MHASLVIEHSQHIAFKMTANANEVIVSRLSIIQDVFNQTISRQTAAEKLASISLSDDTTTEGGVGRLWNLVIDTAREFPEHQDKLVDILVRISKLPDAKTNQGERLVLYDMQVWRDLPMISWQFRYKWNERSVPSHRPSRQQTAMSDFINLNKFTALLMATEEPVFAYSWFALITFREALETPSNHLLPTDCLDAYIPAAAAWIEILGVDIYEWDDEFEHGPLVGAPGKGGLLWEGKHGFCKERWKLWRERFGEMARMESKLGEEARMFAREAELMMKEIEEGDVV